MVCGSSLRLTGCQLTCDVVHRPIGAIMFGEMGDRIVGRKNALVFSIILITVPSVSMGLLPTYEMWGPIAPILLVLLRMLQGLSVGGQLAGSYVISIEQSSAKTRGFRGSVCDASSVCNHTPFSHLVIWFAHVHILPWVLCLSRPEGFCWHPLSRQQFGGFYRMKRSANGDGVYPFGSRCCLPHVYM